MEEPDKDEITLRVRPFDARDGLGAYKVLEEAAEVQVAFKTYNKWKGSYKEAESHAECVMCQNCEERTMYELADELADVIQAAVNLAHVSGIDLAGAMERCTERNEERGRYAV